MILISRSESKLKAPSGMFRKIQGAYARKIHSRICRYYPDSINVENCNGVSVSSHIKI